MNSKVKVADAEQVSAVYVNDQPIPAALCDQGTLLQGLEKYQVPVSYQCRDGYCGSCRVDLIEGEVEYLQDPLACLNQQEILPCCCKAKGTIRIALQAQS